MSKSNAAKILSALIEVYDKPMSIDAQELYISALENDDPDLLKHAAGRAITTLKWFPKVSELKDLERQIQDERNTEEVMDWHADNNERKASPWIRISAWERMAPGDVPCIDWQTCPKCGIQFANWPACPDCTVDL